MADYDEQQVVPHPGDESEAMEKFRQKRKELQKAEINRAELEGTEDDLVLAQKTWLGMHGPVIFNVWQSLYFGLLKEGWQDEEKPAEEENDGGSDHAVHAFSAAPKATGEEVRCV